MKLPWDMERSLVGRFHTYLTRDTHSCTGTCRTRIFNSIFHLHEKYVCMLLGVCKEVGRYGRPSLATGKMTSSQPEPTAPIVSSSMLFSYPKGLQQCCGLAG